MCVCVCEAACGPSTKNEICWPVVIKAHLQWAKPCWLVANMVLAKLSHPAPFISHSHAKWPQRQAIKSMPKLIYLGTGYQNLTNCKCVWNWLQLLGQAIGMVEFIEGVRYKLNELLVAIANKMYIRLLQYLIVLIMLFNRSEFACTTLLQLVLHIMKL